jgi:hypothetical protein
MIFCSLFFVILIVKRKVNQLSLFSKEDSQGSDRAIQMKSVMIDTYRRLKILRTSFESLVDTVKQIGNCISLMLRCTFRK